jgi:hypothetical protein
MGTWGPGVFENDHACDLFEIEVARLRRRRGCGSLLGLPWQAPATGPTACHSISSPASRMTRGGIGEG